LRRDSAQHLFFLRVENNGTIIRDEKIYFSQKHGRDVYE
jgi:hypothetical protein